MKNIIVFVLLSIISVAICESNSWHQKNVRLNADTNVDPHILEYAETVLSLYGLRNAVGNLIWIFVNF